MGKGIAERREAEKEEEEARKGYRRKRWNIYSAYFKVPVEQHEHYIAAAEAAKAKINNLIYTQVEPPGL